MSAISIQNLSKSFPQKGRDYDVLKDFNLEIGAGEFVTVFGPNGSGKSTILNMIAGLESADSGSILINGKNNDESKVGFVFQNFNESMLPWRTVEQNIRLGVEGNVKLKVQNTKIPKQIEGVEATTVSPPQTKIANLLAQTGLESIKNKHFFELSGGQKQLTAIARSFAFEPEILLMDEPFSALDYSVTKKMQLKVLEMWQNFNEKLTRKNEKLTVLFVSHDLDEAIFLADKIVVLSPRPATVKQIIKVDLPRPRTLDMLESQAFFDYRKQVLDIFKYE